MANLDFQTDQGANFISEVFRNTCKILKIKKIQTTAFHPESQGGIERSNRELPEYLRHCQLASDQLGWVGSFRDLRVQYHRTFPHWIYTIWIAVRTSIHLTLRFKAAWHSIHDHYVFWTEKLIAGRLSPRPQETDRK